MKKSIICSMLFFFMLCAAMPTKAEGIEFKHDKTFQELLDMAKAQDKLIFMDCYTAWCGPCKRLAAMVFPDSAVGAYFNDHFINAKFDMEHDEGLTIASKYSIRAYPTLLWIDGNGEVVHKVVGGLDAPGLIANGQKAGDPAPGILSGMNKQYSSGNRDINFLSDYLNGMNSGGQNYTPVFAEYMKLLTEKDLKDPKHSKTIFNLTKNIKDPGMDYVLKNGTHLKGLLGDEAYNSKVNQIATQAADEAAKTSNTTLFNEALALVRDNKGADAGEKTLTLSLDYYSRTNDWVNYDKNATAYIKKYAAKNAPAINDIAWNYYINVSDKAQLTKASKWAYEALNIDNKYTYNLTYAYLLYKMNDLKEAQKACDYAIIRAKEENIAPTSAQALKDAIAKSVAR
jgi:thiol-disulfide isomerase/thioredoxin